MKHLAPPRRRGRFLASALVLGSALPLALLGLGAQGESVADAASAQASDSGVTVEADPTGPFAGLELSVDRTAGLVNEVVNVTWTGGDPTLLTAAGGFLGNYLQLMQCWAEPGKLPDREQCQYGGFVDVPQGFANIASRQVTQFAIDPAETEYVRPPGDFSLKYVDFQSVDGTVTTGRRSQYFDAASTNEVPVARTREGGGGQQFFEVQTGLEAPGLGCGQVINGIAPDCFLVVVPRGLTEVNGNTVGSSIDDPLTTSPLAATNWANRLPPIRLDFLPIGASCQLGRPETPTSGTDLISEAITRWQPDLCEGSPRNFGFTSLADEAARGELASEDPGLVFLTRSAPVDGAVYAPVAISALSMAVNLERQMPNRGPDGRPVPPERVPADVRAQVGLRFEQINLTPRLVAKLLTQSYKFDLAIGTATNLANNPFTIVQDPEFVRENPQVAPQGYAFVTNALGRSLLQAGLLDSADLVWRYVLADAEARAFLAGTPDPWGMVVNERYRDLTLPTNSFPRADLGCGLPVSVPPGFTLENCTLDVFPYVASLQESARAISRGATSRRDIPRPELPPSYGASANQPSGQRAMIGLTDTPSASRYEVVTVALRNAAGEFVTPTTDSMQAAVAQMDRDDRGLLLPDFEAKAADAYPLTLVTYGATVPARLSAEARADYARLLRYAALDGQVPGQAEGGLPKGYVPLPSSLQLQALEAAQQIADYVVPTPTPTPTPTPSASEPGPEPSFAPPPSTDVDSGGFVPTGPVTGGTDPASQPSPAPPASAPAAEATPSTTPVAQSIPTPADPTIAGRYVVVAALLLGAAALLARAVLPWVASRPPG